MLVVAAVAYYAGSVSGSATGFTAGLLLDLLTGATMGASSLVLTAVGYGVGRFREVRDPSHGLLPIAVGAAATAAWVLAFAAVSLMLDIGARVSPLVIRDMIVTVLLNALLALPVFAGVPQAAAAVAGGRPARAAPAPPGPARDRPARPAGARGLAAMYLDNERRPTLTPQLAVRVAIIGGIALVAFAVIFFRLWYLQVLSGDKYVAEAKSNQLREIKVQAPRGEIVDREGRVLVRNRVGLAVTITPDTLPEERARRARRSTGAWPSCSACARRGSSGAWTSSSRSCPSPRPRSSRT